MFPRKRIKAPAVFSLLLLFGTACAGRAQGASGSKAGTGKVPKVGAIAPTICPGVPGTEVDLATLSNKTQFENTCYTALANVALVILFVNNTIAQSGKPVSLGISVYQSPDEGYTVTDNGNAFVPHPDKAIFKGDEILAPNSTLYKLPALPAGSYWIQSDPIAPIMNAWLVVENPGP